MNHNVETITLANWKEIRLILKCFFDDLIIGKIIYFSHPMFLFSHKELREKALLMHQNIINCYHFTRFCFTEHRTSYKILNLIDPQYTRSVIASSGAWMIHEFPSHYILQDYDPNFNLSLDWYQKSKNDWFNHAFII